MMDKLGRWLDRLFLGAVFATAFLWWAYPEDIVGTRELAVVLITVVWCAWRCGNMKGLCKPKKAGLYVLRDNMDWEIIEQEG